MKKRFVIAVNSANAAQQEALVQFFKDQKVGWWHWLSNLWLVTDSRGQLSAASIRGTLKQILPGVHTVVLELNDEGDTWAGFGPNTENKSMFKWLKDHWKK
jgi:hypothetical protein